MQIFLTFVKAAIPRDGPRWQGCHMVIHLARGGEPHIVQMLCDVLQHSAHMGQRTRLAHQEGVQGYGHQQCIIIFLCVCLCLICVSEVSIQCEGSLLHTVAACLYSQFQEA